MQRIIIGVLLFFFLITVTAGCDITNLVTQDKENKMEEGTGEKDSPVFQGEGDLSDEVSSQQGFKDAVRINPDIQYEIENKEGYYSIGPLKGHIVNIQWNSPNSLEFRLDNEEKTIISNCVIDESGLKADALIEAPGNGIYINNSLKDGKGLIFISLMNEKNFYLYKNNELKEYKNIQYYYLSPLQGYVILFSGDFKAKPLLIDLSSGTETSLPLEADHGWPEYTAGLSFSEDETKLLYEDWSRMELCIYDIKNEKELMRIGEKDFNLIEGALSPNGKMAAYLKCDSRQEYIKIEGGRNPVGEKLAIYDLDKKKVIKEISGESLIYSKPIWSTDGKYLAFNMIENPNEKETGKKLIGNPYVLNISTGKTTKLSDNEEGLKYVIAWSDDNRKVMADYKSAGILNRPSAIEIKQGDELEIDKNEYYISRIKKSGTDVYEIIGINNSKLDQFDKKSNVALSTDEKYIAFGAIIDGSEYLIIALK